MTPRGGLPCNFVVSDFSRALIFFVLKLILPVRPFPLGVRLTADGLFPVQPMRLLPRFVLPRCFPVRPFSAREFDLLRMPSLLLCNRRDFFAPIFFAEVRQCLFFFPCVVPKKAGGERIGKEGTGGARRGAEGGSRLVCSATAFHSVPLPSTQEVFGRHGRLYGGIFRLSVVSNLTNPSAGRKWMKYFEKATIIRAECPSKGAHRTVWETLWETFGQGFSPCPLESFCSDPENVSLLLLGGDGSSPSYLGPTRMLRTFPPVRLGVFFSVLEYTGEREEKAAWV